MAIRPQGLKQEVSREKMAWLLHTVATELPSSPPNRIHHPCSHLDYATVPSTSSFPPSFLEDFLPAGARRVVDGPPPQWFLQRCTFRNPRDTSPDTLVVIVIT